VYVLCFCRNKNLVVHVRVISGAYVRDITILFNYFFSIPYYILYVGITCSVVQIPLFLLVHIYARIALLGQFHPCCPSTYPYSYRVRIVPSVDVLLQLFTDWNLSCGCVLCAVVLIICNINCIVLLL
jgi:hypothetical protein